jgi:hypothetical protein
LIDLLHRDFLFEGLYSLLELDPDRAPPELVQGLEPRLVSRLLPWFPCFYDEIHCLGASSRWLLQLPPSTDPKEK